MRSISLEKLSSWAPILPIANTMYPQPVSRCCGSTGRSLPRSAASASRKRTAAPSAVSATSVSAWVTRASGQAPPMSASAISSAASAFMRRRIRISGSRPEAAAAAARVAPSSAASSSSGSLRRGGLWCARDRPGGGPRGKARSRRFQRVSARAPGLPRPAISTLYPMFFEQSPKAMPKRALRAPAEGSGSAPANRRTRAPSSRLRCGCLPRAGRFITSPPGRRAAGRSCSSIREHCPRA